MDLRGVARFHGAAAVTMVATPSLMSELRRADSPSRHVDAQRDVDLFVPTAPSTRPRGNFMQWSASPSKGACPPLCPAPRSSSAPGEGDPQAQFSAGEISRPAGQWHPAAHLAAADAPAFRAAPTRSASCGMRRCERRSPLSSPVRGRSRRAPVGFCTPRPLAWTR